MDTQPEQPSGADHPRGDPPPGRGPQYPGQPPVIAATGTGWPRVRPGRVWYLAALAVLLAGVAWAVVGLISVSRQVVSSSSSNPAVINRCFSAYEPNEKQPKRYGTNSKLGSVSTSFT